MNLPFNGIRYKYIVPMAFATTQIYATCAFQVLVFFLLRRDQGHPRPLKKTFMTSLQGEEEINENITAHFA